MISRVYVLHSRCKQGGSRGYPLPRSDCYVDYLACNTYHLCGALSCVTCIFSVYKPGEFKWDIPMYTKKKRYITRGLRPPIYPFYWCLLAWFRRFAMADNSIMEAEFKGMSSSTPVNPFKPETPFTPESDSSLDLSENYFGSSSRRCHSTNTFAPQNESDNYSADLFTHHRKFMKPVKNPADYDGTQSLRDYLKHFEHCSVVNGWSKEEAAIFLAASLRGEAQKVLNGLSETDY